MMYSTFLFIETVYAGPIADAEPVSSLVVDVLHFVLSIAGGLAVLMIVIAGFLYMTSAGDPDRITRAKAALTTGIVGMCVVLLALVIVTAITGLV